MSRINLYQTPEHSCPYLPDQTAITQFIDPAKTPDIEMYTHLTKNGFRRSGEHIYRPACPNCNACISIRVAVNAVVHTKSQRRCLSSAKQLTISHIPATDSEEHYLLYEKYINGRHKGGDMYPPSRELYSNFLFSSWASTQFMEIRNNSTLIACAVYDQLVDGISAVYCYFDPDEKKLSLGKLSILKQIEYAKKHQIEHLYLGYQIDDCDKMNYKNKYQPAEQFKNTHWQAIE